jgi:hypothetical protein
MSSKLGTDGVACCTAIIFVRTVGPEPFVVCLEALVIEDVFVVVVAAGGLLAVPIPSRKSSEALSIVTGADATVEEEWPFSALSLEGDAWDPIVGIENMSRGMSVVVVVVLEIGDLPFGDAPTPDVFVLGFDVSNILK